MSKGKTLKKRAKPRNAGTRSRRRKAARIYILYTGGTIGMSYKPKIGLLPIRGVLSKMIKGMDIPKSLNIKYHIDVMDPLIDSSNLSGNNWKAMLEKLYANYTKYDAFVILHGTDTLAYTSSLLSFFLRDWRKSVIVTGSQIPMFEFRNDAVQNIQDSIIMSLYRIPQVMIVFGGKILRGNCTSKYSSTSFEAYKSPNVPPLGDFGVHLNINKSQVEHGNSRSTLPVVRSLPSRWKLDNWNNDLKILTFNLAPDQTSSMSQIIQGALVSASKPHAIILRSYGVGNAPVTDKVFMETIGNATKQGVVVVNTTQCFTGGVHMSYYQTGRTLKEHRVISAGQMTSETVYSKLYYLFQVIGTDNPGKIRKLFETNIAGESFESQFNVRVREDILGYFKKYQELG